VRRSCAGTTAGSVRLGPGAFVPAAGGTAAGRRARPVGARPRPRRALGAWGRAQRSAAAARRRSTSSGRSLGRPPTARCRCSSRWPAAGLPPGAASSSEVVGEPGARRPAGVVDSCPRSRRSASASRSTTSGRASRPSPGCSSLPADRVKLDRSFTTAQTRLEGPALVRGVSALAGRARARGRRGGRRDARHSCRACTTPVQGCSRATCSAVRRRSAPPRRRCSSPVRRSPAPPAAPRRRPATCGPSSTSTPARPTATRCSSRWRGGR
jgi:hypothetical protein